MKVTVAALVLGLALLVATDAGQVRVTSGDAAVRLRPTAASALVATVPAGMVLDVRGREGDWYAVELPPDADGLRRYGYVAAVQVEVLAAGPSNSSGVPMPPETLATRAFVLDPALRSVGVVDLASQQVDLLALSADFLPRRGPVTGGSFFAGSWQTTGTPAEMLLSPDGTRLVVVDHGDGNVSAPHGWHPARRSLLMLIDTASKRPLGTVDGVWGRPTLHHVDPDGRRLTIAGPGFRSGKRDDTRPAEIVIVDLHSAATLARHSLDIAVGSVPLAGDWAWNAALSSDARFLYLLDPGRPSKDRARHVDGRISVVSTLSGRPVAVLPAGSAPRGFITDVPGDQVLLLSDHPPYVKAREQRQGELRIIRGDELAATVPVTADPWFLRASPDGAAIHVFSSRGLTTVDAIALRETGELAVRRAGISWLSASGPGTIADAAISPDGKRAYVLHAGSSRLSILDLERRTVAATVTTGRTSAKVGLFLAAAFATALSKASAAYVAQAAGMPFYFYTAYYPAASRTQIAIRPDGRFLYVLNSQSNDVTVVDAAAARVARHVPVSGAYLHAVAGSDYLCVAGPSAVRFIDMRTHAENDGLEVAGDHAAVTFSPDAGHLFVLSSGQVTALDARTGRRVARFGQLQQPVQMLFATVPVETGTASAAGSAAAPRDDPYPATRWAVWHLHRATFCGGMLYATDERLGFRSTPDEPHSWEVPFGAVEEIKVNRAYGGGGRLGSFHVTLAGGAHYNFTLDGVRADALVAALNEKLSRARQGVRPK